MDTGTIIIIIALTSIVSIGATAIPLLLWLARLREQATILQTTLDNERAAAAQHKTEQLALLEESNQRFNDAFNKVSSEALRNLSGDFLKQADAQFQLHKKDADVELGKRTASIEGLMKSTEEQIKKLSEYNAQIEKNRLGTYTALDERVKGLIDSQKSLDRQTQKLVEGLRKPDVRGRWGEVQLRRIVEMSGLEAHCDFEEQVSIQTLDSGNRQRPDMIVHIPGDKLIIVDSKVPLDSYLSALDSNDEIEKEKFLLGHVRQIRAKITDLGSKNYSSQFPKAVHFVVMFVPGEGIFSTAWHSDPTLLEFAFQNHVIIATPITLIALLKTIAQCWSESRLTDEIMGIVQDAKIFYKQTGVLLNHIADIGKNLEQCTVKYNALIGSIENRFMPAARRLENKRTLFGGSDEPLPELAPIEKTVRPFTKKTEELNEN